MNENTFFPAEKLTRKNMMPFKKVVKKTRPAGLEPATFGFEVRDSIQLSYGRPNSSVLRI